MAVTFAEYEHSDDPTNDPFAAPRWGCGGASNGGGCNSTIKICNSTLTLTFLELAFCFSEAKPNRFDMNCCFIGAIY